MASETHSKTVCSSISVEIAFNAFRRIVFLSSISSSRLKLGFPTGYGIAMAGTILFAPTACEIGTIEQTCATGIPKLSIVFAIVAPQRVHVPQLEVRMAAWIPSNFILCATSIANFFALATAVALPTVAK